MAILRKKEMEESKKLLHVVMTSHDEVIARDEEDFNVMLNLIALAAASCNVELLADAEMSTHAHLGGYFRNEGEFVRRFKNSHTSYFNHKYHRSGRLWDKGFYSTELVGINRIITAISYILRNGLHHGQAKTAFGYRFCSVNDVFPEDRGIKITPPLIFKDFQKTYLPEHAVVPEHFQMGQDGVFLRRSFMNIELVEHFFKTPRSFLFCMNRLTGEEWMKEQDEDGIAGKRIGLEDIEIQERTMSKLLQNEKGFGSNVKSDLEVCALADSMLPAGKTIYTVDDAARRHIAEYLYRAEHISVECLKRTVLNCTGR